MVVSCIVCSQPMIIDEPGGIAYITEADGSIHHVPHSYTPPPPQAQPDGG